jgi:hypothetical protein
MDHHCFWTGNTCIGRGNLKSFILYLLYLFLGSLYQGLILTRFLTISALEIVDMMFYSFNLIIVMFLGWGLALIIGVFLVINVFIVLRNQTLREITEGVQVYQERFNT